MIKRTKTSGGSLDNTSSEPSVRNPIRPLGSHSTLLISVRAGSEVSSRDAYNQSRQYRRRSRRVARTVAGVRLSHTDDSLTFGTNHSTG